MDTNFFGAVWVTRAALPFLRRQGSGHIIVVRPWAAFLPARCSASTTRRSALEGLTQSLAANVRDFGIKVTILEPTGYKTPAEASAVESDRLPAYEQNWARLAERRPMAEGRGGDPAATPAALLQVVDSDDPPLRLCSAPERWTS